MVNTVNVSAYKGTPPQEPSVDGRHYIEGGPIYSLEDLESLLDQGENLLRLWTKDCVKDVQNLFDGDLSGVLELLKTIAADKARYLKSEWCVQKPTGPWAACDSYQILREEWIQHAHKYMSIEYYVKFAIGKTGSLLLVISCH